MDGFGGDGVDYQRLRRLVRRRVGYRGFWRVGKRGFSDLVGFFVDSKGGGSRTLELDRILSPLHRRWWDFRRVHRRKLTETGTVQKRGWKWQLSGIQRWVMVWVRP